jgi:hypothetical protein
MIEGAKAAYPDLNFAVADCSKPLTSPPDESFDLVFAGWFLNYAGTEAELVSMFRVIEQNLRKASHDGTKEGRFVGITTNVNDIDMHLPKPDFYGLDIVVLDPAYKAPGSEEVIGIKAQVNIHTENPISFDVYQFTKKVYERCAKEAGLWVRWTDAVVPEDERKVGAYWDRFLERPTFVVIEAGRL